MEACTEMRINMKKLLCMLIVIICLPLIASLFIKPDRSEREKKETDTKVTNLPFMVMIYENKGTFGYEPEETVGSMVAAIAPMDDLSDFADIENFSGIQQEYLKALAVVCRTNLVHAWELEGRPDNFDFDKYGLPAKKMKANEPVSDEIRKAVEDTAGAVMADVDLNEKTVIAAPFFTSSDWDIQLGEVGEGEGLSVNYAWLLACEKYSFSEILKYFFENIQIIIMQ